MKTYTHSKIVSNIELNKLWDVWSDINHWHTWQNDIDYATLDGDFKEGNIFTLKPKGGPKVKIQLLKVVPNKQFVDLTTFPLAKMYGDHTFIVHGEEIEIKTTMTIDGPLAFLWNKIVMEGIVKKLDSQTDNLIKKAIQG
ncbi:MAG: SRPBCC family protein [Bacteriovorax sp.]|nr:SRPBCC family protein [Bacteriovorax sp.]